MHRIASNHMHRMASVCNPTDLFCTKEGRHRTICTASHQFVIRLICFVQKNNAIRPYAPHRIGPYAPHRTICTASDHMHRIASVCNPTDLFCTKEERHQTICTAPHRTICTAPHQFAFRLICFEQKKNGIRPYAPHRIGPYAQHRIGVPM